MGYYDAYTANLFREDREGRRVFAPFGNPGGVFLVPDDVDATRIVAGVQWLYRAVLAGSVAFVAAGVWLWLRTQDASMLLPTGFFAMCGAVFAYQLARAQQ